MSDLPRGPVGHTNTDTIDTDPFIVTELVDDVPTAHKDGDGILDWSVTPMPAPARVATFLDKLSATLTTRSTSASSPPSGWRPSTSGGAASRRPTPRRTGGRSC